MARRSEDIYGRFGIYGSNAYDFGVSGKDRNWEYCSAEKSVKKSVVKHELRSLALIFGCILCAVLLGVGLISRASLIVLSNETVSLQKELEELSDSNTRLKIQHAMLFPMSETEEYAIEVLGMQKPGPDQIFDVETENTFVGEADKEYINKSGILSAIRAFFSG